MEWRPVDYVALILASAVAIALLVTTIAPVILKAPISDERTKSIATATSAIIAVISVYVGAMLEAD